jgi:hypothetical protein
MPQISAPCFSLSSLEPIAAHPRQTVDLLIPSSQGQISTNSTTLSCSSGKTERNTLRGRAGETELEALRSLNRLRILHSLWCGSPIAAAPASPTFI